MILNEFSKIEFLDERDYPNNITCDINVNGRYFARIYTDGEVYVNDFYVDTYGGPWLKYANGEEAVKDFKSVFGC